jgi:hypothetical protein
MSKTIVDIAMDNASKLGACLGVMKFLIEHGDMTNFDWKQLARMYVKVTGEDEWYQQDITYIRGEAIRRGVDIGE